MSVPTPQPYPPRMPQPQSNGLGKTAFIISVVVVFLGHVSSWGSQYLLFSDPGNYAANSVIYAVSAAILGLMSIIALILGLLALSRTGLSKTLAAVAIALSATNLLGLASGFVMPIVMNALIQ